MMVDSAYPLAFTKDGDIQVLKNDDDGSVSAEQTRAHVVHMLDTVTGERRLYPDFGVDLSLLFHAIAPELACERFRITLAQLTGIYSRVSVKNISANTLSLKVDVSTQSIVVNYG